MPTTLDASHFLQYQGDEHSGCCLISLV